MLSEAAAGKGDPDLVKLVDQLLSEVERGAMRNAEGSGEVKKAMAATAVKESRMLLARGKNPKAEEEFKLDIRDILRWIIDITGLKEIPKKLGDDDPRDVKPPKPFGEELDDPGWQLQESLLSWKALKLTSGPGDDEMRITGSFHYNGQAGRMPPRNDVFKADGRSNSGNNHVLSRVTLIPGQPGLYMGIHLLTERDVTDDATAKKVADIITGILGKIASGVLSSGLGTAADATGIPGAGAIADAVTEIIAGASLKMPQAR